MAGIKSQPTVGQVSIEAGERPDQSRLKAVGSVLQRGVEQLFAEQANEGHWCAELEGDSILQSEYILLQYIIEKEDDPRLVKIANYLRNQQRAEDGAWVQYPGAKPDMNATVKAYFALKLMAAPLLQY